MSRECDLLLTWLSARETPPSQARIEEARQFLTARGANPYATFQTLHRLGHIEEIGTGRWRVVPPTLVWHETEGVGHFYGARTPQLWETLQAELGSRIEAWDPPDGPQLWSVAGEEAHVRAAVEQLGVRVQRERGEDLLAALPPLSVALCHLPRELAPARLRLDWQHWVHRSWRPFETHRAPEAGLYRPVERQGASWLCVLPPRAGFSEAVFLDAELHAIGTWWELARQGNVHLVYDRPNRELGVSRIPWTRLPVLLDRALCLASGRCPATRDEGGAEFLVYPRVSRRRARLAARVLELPLEIRR